MNVVLIEDETMVRHMLRATVQKAGGLSVVAEFGDGSEALAYCLKQKPEMVICDLNLPGMHGLDVIRGLRIGTVGALDDLARLVRRLS